MFQCQVIEVPPCLPLRGLAPERKLCSRNSLELHMSLLAHDHRKIGDPPMLVQCLALTSVVNVSKDFALDSLPIPDLGAVLCTGWAEI